jgi:hypothetical protein
MRSMQAFQQLNHIRRFSSYIVHYGERNVGESLVSSMQPSLQVSDL